MSPWEGSTRRERLPDNWQELRAIVFKRCGGRCEAIMRSGKRCHDPAKECDHIVRGDNHDLSNLQGLCVWHHKRKTAAEGNEARTHQSKARPPEPHPGAI